MTEGFRRTLGQGLAALGIELNGATIARLECYGDELVKWSRGMNLIGKSSSESDIAERHFLDSLTLLGELPAGGAHLLDIGSGAGFPGLVCRVASPELRVTLVEPRAKRVSFLRHIARTLQLEGVEVLACRAEDLQWPQAAPGVTHLACRALSEIGRILPMVERFAPQRPSLLLMKGPNWRQEMSDAASVMAASAFRLTAAKTWRLPVSGATRVLLRFEVAEPAGSDRGGKADNNHIFSS